MLPGGRRSQNNRGPPGLQISRQHQGENTSSSEQQRMEFVRAVAV